MADQEEEDLRMAMRMSMQHEPPEPKRSKPRENVVGGGGPAGSPEESRKMQRELMAAAAERRMVAARGAAAAAQMAEKSVAVAVEEKGLGDRAEGQKCMGDSKGKNVELGKELSLAEANQLFLMVFGSAVTRDILAQWSNQGIRFSSDPETSMGLVQHEGGPCGVLAAIQAFVLKYLLFFPEELGKATTNMPSNLGSRRSSKSECIAPDDLFASLADDRKSRALVRSMGEILFLCGNNRSAVIATLSILDLNIEGVEDSLKDEVIVKALEGLSIESGSDLQKFLRVNTYTSQASAFQTLQAMIPVFRSRMGAMLFLISALLSRGLDSVQADRDDPSQSLVTAPFGHASQEIVNLLLCGQAVAHVFDGRMDLGGDMFLKGISTNVEVGFLTLLEYLNFCKVGLYLKCPKWPIWVIGSESHYTVLFALDTSVQDENEFEGRETQIRRAFDAQDQSGGGGFISVEGFHHVLKETSINLPPEKLDHLCSSGFIVWSEFWQVLLDLDKSLGGLKDSTGMMGKKVFDLYHFNGIAKSDLNGGQATSGGETPIQRPRLTKLRVLVPPKWTPEEFMADVKLPSDSSSKDTVVEVSKPEPAQHAPLVDCIRTRWARATCNWIGDPPSIV
ncbi:Ubiquitin carboxyl-terminal hydrolase MINDY-3 [Camellia lanceoleosa]|uniref:Ubiquitin carboxyl-terminal hydrolase MINDY-3 n=2 Tax=Camellia lanceoleosa TaxID=1840588 RepID=A0ACC0G9L6_9ERIC|nr:Ubiquitin carboxyl-terminal hydrolase MINDY-3 [Camellia lanceoleosa]KAI8012972.1 Ubiquitin carboxyl-terminal hydrolase MINDY-3 [Camellia lanceoleosa]